jgi:cysteine desulfuration protein SufE
MTINEIQDELISDFELFDEQLDKTQYIIDLGKKLPPIDEKYKTDEYLIHGCQSKVWLAAEFRDGRLYFLGDGEPTAQIAKGLISILIKILSGQKPEDIANADLYIMERVGMGALVTSRRSGGLAAMIQKMKGYGTVYSQLEV